MRLGKGYEPQAVSHSTAAVGTHGPHIVPCFSVRHGGFRIRSMQDVCGSAYQFWVKHADLTLHVWIRLCIRFRGPAPLNKKSKNFNCHWNTALPSTSFAPIMHTYLTFLVRLPPPPSISRSHYAYLPYLPVQRSITSSRTKQ